MVNDIRPKTPRLRLDPIAYENLRQQMLRRDGWRCQSCGAMAHLEVHHREFRSHSGDDSELNLMTLCTVCHSQTHCRPQTMPRRLHLESRKDDVVPPR